VSVYFFLATRAFLSLTLTNTTQQPPWKDASDGSRAPPILPVVSCKLSLGRKARLQQSSPLRPVCRAA